ncbi:uncharacterized protein CEXT_630121 [Caerostris extrusa]|uniref:Homologous recombination OB-fold protein OB-fold domain-containing protein n=1 Tax=Caerostris extrusa TaxID=172846 RepID=A0AAV4YCQ8_CAEEX|nr:uncharacterized protein CEXT_630121 [Caerostris extrusa]
MTVNFSSDLDDDDFLNNTFRNISENDLLSFDVSSSPSRNLSNQLELKQVQFEIHNQSLNSTLDSNKNNHDLVKSSTSVNSKSVNPSKKDSLSFLFKKRKENDTLNHEEIFTGDDISNLNQSTVIDKTSKINSRFVPGFTPKAKKRKLPGPAGFFSTNTNMPCDSDPLLTASTNSEIEIQNITNSQFSAEDLLLPSWQNLQRDVSSCQALLSTAKYYSIRRVLHETSKKKLPKHLVVPILCVLIKKFDPEESSLNFIDDTGEISGKINKEVLDTYKDCIKSGTALILKKK